MQGRRDLGSEPRDCSTARSECLPSAWGAPSPRSQGWPRKPLTPSPRRLPTYFDRHRQMYPFPLGIVTSPFLKSLRVFVRIREPFTLS